MFSLQKLFGKDKEFFVLLEASGEECHASLETLKRFLAAGTDGPSLDAFAASRRKDKMITAQIAELLSRVSVTALEPEDIEVLSNSLYKIPKTVEKFAERYLLTPELVRGVDFSPQLVLLEEAVRIVRDMLKALRDNAHVDRIAEQNARLQRVEGDADKLMLSLLRDLYTRRNDPVSIVILKDLYDLLERVIDRCRDVGNVVSNIALKNS